MGTDRYEHMDMDELKRRARLYDVLRAATPREFTELWNENIKTGCRYDELVEGLARRQGAA